jgi:dCTP diphosphatase
VTPPVLSRVAEEIADVQIYLARLAYQLGVDIATAVKDKIESNRKKYPAELVRGKAVKYTEFEGGSET